MTAALRLAAVRALEALPVRPDAVILDGKHDYLGAPWQVRTVIKGDQSCVAVAAASVIAKVRRDAMMAELRRRSTPTSPSPTTPAIPRPCTRRRSAELGPTPYHRLSWAYLDALPRGGTSRRSAISAGDGRTGKRGPARLRLLTRCPSRQVALMCPPADAFRTGI